MLYRQKTRTRTDYKPEFAALKLPAHPVTRYAGFRNKWKSTRKVDHAPTPANKKKVEACCFQCLKLSGAIAPGQLPNRAIWEKTARHRWLDARWIWDFGFLLPAGLIDYGVGESPDIAGFLEPKDYLFDQDPTTFNDAPVVLDEDGKNNLTLTDHATLTGDDLHEPKLRVFNFAVPKFAGELGADGTNHYLVGAKTASSFTNLKVLDESSAALCTWGSAVDGGFYKNAENKLVFQPSQGVTIEL